MHTKIITQQNDPNFLTHVIWFKTSLGVQHIHLELLWNLSYEILKKNKHNSRINISCNYIIVINSPEVCFEIKRQCANVGCKNLIILARKIIYADSAEMGKHFYKKIYIIPLCNVLLRSYS
jgi:hypothetical protein